MKIREYESSDAGETARLFYETVHAVNARDYTESQLDAWATGLVDPEAWDASFRSGPARVATMDGLIVGFGNISFPGYLDKLFVHKDFQRRGIATAICDELERMTIDRIEVHASITARPFFERRGYREIVKQTVERNGIFLTNFVMEKQL